MITISYIVAIHSPDYIMTSMVKISSKKQRQMITISYIVATHSPDYIITVMVEIPSKNGTR